MRQKREKKVTVKDDAAKPTRNRSRPSKIPRRSPLSKMKERVSSRLESFGLHSLRQGNSSSSGNLNLSAKNEASKTALQNVHDMPSTSKASPPPAEPETTSSPTAPSIGSRKRAQSGNINSTSGVSTTPDSFRKRKLAFSRDSPSKLPDAKKPLLEQATTLSDEQEQTKSHIPRLKLKSKSEINLIIKEDNKMGHIDSWLNAYQNFTEEDQRIALERLIDNSTHKNIRFMRDVIEPRFQRDFISLLPPELALHVLSKLEPKDLVSATQTCRTWRQLADDNTIWRQKCLEENVKECSTPILKQYKSWAKTRTPEIVGENIHSPWKKTIMRKKRIEKVWIEGDVTPLELVGHDDHVVTCLQFDGQRIVSGSDDSTLKVWNAKTGHCQSTLIGHTGGVWCLEMKDDWIVSGSTDRTLRVWSAETGKCIETLYGHCSTVRCMALSGNQVVSGSRDNTLRVWDLTTLKCTAVLVGHFAAVRCVCFDGKKIVSGSYDNTVKIWDPNQAGNKLLHTLQGHTMRVYSLQFDGKHVVSGSLDTNIMVWDADTGTLLHTLVGHQSLTSGMELRGKTLVSGNADSFVKIWDIETGLLVRTLDDKNKHSSAVTSLQYCGKFIVTSSDDGTVKLWNAETGEWIRDLVSLDTRQTGGVVWRIKASETKLVCAVGSRNGTELTKLLVLNFDDLAAAKRASHSQSALPGTSASFDAAAINFNSLGHVNPT
ncbi:unnamed protein product [Oikopleura dioica]|uniref:F-box domain-containing protein n=1 Tax=Oikopleura dioica TaxID=34765 RepID=E4X7U6_OIKDI|nr:unnamed protein product [Oikopleura dioica]